MKSKTCCFTGHRHLPENQRAAIAAKLEETIISLIRSGYRYFGAGGALGFDTLAAQTVLHLRKTYPQIRLILVLPCASQPDKWAPADIAVYREIMDQADKTVCISREYTKDCMFRRNRHLVDHSSVCICYLEKKSGGTAYTVGYAKSRGLRILNLAEKQDVF